MEKKDLASVWASLRVHLLAWEETDRLQVSASDQAFLVLFQSFLWRNRDRRRARRPRGCALARRVAVLAWARSHCSWCEIVICRWWFTAINERHSLSTKKFVATQYAICRLLAGSPPVLFGAHIQSGQAVVTRKRKCHTSELPAQKISPQNTPKVGFSIFRDFWYEKLYLNL